MKKDEKRAVGIIFIIALILILVLEYSNYTTAEKIQSEYEKIEARLEAVKAKDSIESKSDYPTYDMKKLILLLFIPLVFGCSASNEEIEKIIKNEK